MWYRWKTRLLKRPRVNYWWRYLQARRGRRVGSYDQLPDHIRKLAPGKSFADIGCMWGVNGEFSFLAEEAGACPVKAVDVFGPTPEFEEKRRGRGSLVEFILGDIGHPDTLARVGTVDVVFCAGVLYHHPSPFDLLVALRRICGGKMILRTSTIPEVKGLPNAAVYFPKLSAKERKLWDLRRLGLMHQAGISSAFRPEEGYSNWFWGLSPSCLQSLVQTAGFAVEFAGTEPFAQTLICRAVDSPFMHRLPDEAEAKSMAETVSAARIARPA